MKFQIEYPKAGEYDNQMKEIVLFMVKHHQIIIEPVLFVMAWHEKKMKIFTMRENDEIVGLHIVSLITDPVTGEMHKIDNFKAGEEMDNQVAEVLSVY